MFGRKSEEEKAAEAVAKVQADAKEKTAQVKKKYDYINEKTKKTEKELLAEILWNLSLADNSPTKYMAKKLEEIKLHVVEVHRSINDPDHTPNSDLKW